MHVWRVASVDDEPEVLLSPWRILETPDGLRYFLGLDIRDRTGRVSTPVLKFDPGTRQGETESGRRYQTVRPAGHTANSQYLWGHWCVAREVQSYTDVTQCMLEGSAKG